MSNNGYVSATLRERSIKVARLPTLLYCKPNKEVNSEYSCCRS